MVPFAVDPARFSGCSLSLLEGAWSLSLLGVGSMRCLLVCAPPAGLLVRAFRELLTRIVAALLNLEVDKVVFEVHNLNRQAARDRIISNHRQPSGLR